MVNKFPRCAALFARFVYLLRDFGALLQHFAALSGGFARLFEKQTALLRPGAYLFDDKTALPSRLQRCTIPKHPHFDEKQRCLTSELACFVARKRDNGTKQRCSVPSNICFETKQRVGVAEKSSETSIRTLGERRI